MENNPKQNSPERPSPQWPNDTYQGAKARAKESNDICKGIAVDGHSSTKDQHETCRSPKEFVKLVEMALPSQMLSHEFCSTFFILHSCSWDFVSASFSAGMIRITGHFVSFLASALTRAAEALTMHTRKKQDCFDSGSLRWRRKLLVNFDLMVPAKAWYRVGPGKKIYNPWKKNLRVSPPLTPGKKI